MKLVIGAYVALAWFAILGCPSPAHAQSQEAARVDDAVEAPSSPVQFHLDAAAGVSTAGVLVNALGLVRFGIVEVGGSYGSSGLFSDRTGGGVALGAGNHRRNGRGFDVLFELGVNKHHVSGDLLSSDPGASGSIPYGGVRAGVDWSFGHSEHLVHPTLGLWIFGRLDLASRTASYEYGSFSSNDERSRSGSVQVGGGGEAGIAIAGGFDLVP